jgi:16S rRNA pseudouridine516 synthase
VKLLKLIANLGYGTRREVAAMFADGLVRSANGAPLNEKSICEYAQIRLAGAALDPAPGSVLLMHKPCGYTCSTTDPKLVIYDLLPERFRLRSPIMACVGRLDRQTSGLLLLTDDGQLLHKITSPKTHLPKSYIAELAQPLEGHEAEIFASGTLMLEGETTPLRPAELHIISANCARVTISEGRYHQVRRMFAALGNHVETLHRSRIGGLELGALEPGQWRVLSASELRLVMGSGA